jgi:hypothetical protein
MTFSCFFFFLVIYSKNPRKTNIQVEKDQPLKLNATAGCSSARDVLYHSFNHLGMTNENQGTLQLAQLINFWIVILNQWTVKTYVKKNDFFSLENIRITALYAIADSRGKKESWGLRGNATVPLLGLDY